MIIIYSYVTKSGKIKHVHIHISKYVYTFTDLPTATNIRPVSEICVTSFNISWDVSNSITCGDVSYELSISPPPIEGNAVATTDNMFYSVTGLNNSLPNVTITVTAISNRGGQGNNRTFLVELPKPLSKIRTIHIYVCMLTVCTLINMYVHSLVM